MFPLLHFFQPKSSLVHYVNLPNQAQPVLDTESLNKKFPLCQTGLRSTLDDDLSSDGSNPQNPNPNSTSQSQSSNSYYLNYPNKDSDSLSPKHPKNFPREKKRPKGGLKILAQQNAETLKKRDAYLKNISYGLTDSLFEIQSYEGFTVPRYHKSIITAEGIILLSGGFENEQPSKQCFLFDIVRGKMSSIEPMNYGRTGHALVLHNSFVYVVGGVTEERAPSRSCEIFSPDRNCWELLPELNFACHSACATSFNENLYKFGGKDDDGNICSVIGKYFYWFRLMGK